MRTNRPADLKSIPREWRKIARHAVKEDGWEILITGAQHLKWRGPNGQHFITGMSPTRNGAVGKNTLLLMRRNGINIQPTAA